LAKERSLMKKYKLIVHENSTQTQTRRKNFTYLGLTISFFGITLSFGLQWLNPNSPLLLFSWFLAALPIFLFIVPLVLSIMKSKTNRLLTEFSENILLKRDTDRQHKTKWVKWMYYKSEGDDYLEFYPQGNFSQAEIDDLPRRLTEFLNSRAKEKWLLKSQVYDGVSLNLYYSHVQADRFEFDEEDL
jgi:hypothetical protein